MITRRIKDRLLRLRYLLFVYQEIKSVLGALETLDRKLEVVQEALGIECPQVRASDSRTLHDHEFRVFSQWGEDGIIQFLLSNLEIDRKVFVEFGADNCNAEANTRFLLTNNNWSGLVIDSSAHAINLLRHTPSYWLYNLKAVEAFVTRANINELLINHGITGEIGLLSIRH